MYFALQVCGGEEADVSRRSVREREDPVGVIYRSEARLMLVLKDHVRECRKSK